MNIAQELKIIANSSAEPYIFEASETETKSAYVYLITRFRTMSYNGHTSAAFRISDSMWKMPDLKAAMSMLEDDGFVIEWHPNAINDVIAIRWS